MSKNPDMLGFSNKQIEEYAEAARAKKLSWAER